MSMPSKNEIRSRPPLWMCILVVMILYVLQGVTLGIVSTIPIYLASFGATWKQLGTLTFVMYPFTIKLLWAPFIDVFYIRRLGRRQTWLLPVQIMLGIIFIILSFYLELLLVQLHVIRLTIVLFFVILLTATQDICVDGWALTLFSSSHIIWQSISQMIGQPFGSFIGSSVLLTFESANMTNRLLRYPLGIATQSYGLFTLTQFVRFWGIMFLITTCTVTILFRQQKENTKIDNKNHNDNHLNLFETYIYIIKLFKKKCFRQFIIILMGPHVGYAATSAMTFVTLISRGMIKREILGLITMPLILIKVTIPLLLSRTNRPLIFYAHSYLPRLIVCLFIAIFVFFSSRLQSYPILFYSILIFLLGIDDAFIYLQGAARGGFFGYISDKRIGSTYYTLVASLNNMGMFVSSSIVLYTANWLPKEHAYYIEVSICILLGCVWLCISWRLMHRLQRIPVERWHLLPEKRQLDEDHHPMTTVDIRTANLSTVPIHTELPSWL